MKPEDTRIAIPGTNNVRDLGGYPAADGRAVAPRTFYRSEVLAQPSGSEFTAIWDAAHSAHYEALGVRTIIDLRSAHEVESTPSAWALATGAEVIELPIAEGGEGSDTHFFRRIMDGEMAGFDADDMARFYIEALERRSEVFAAAVRVLAVADHLPALVHCSAGKDRTGILVALVLEVLGTPREVVVQDYAQTGIFRPNRVAAYAELLDQAGIAPDKVRALFETPAPAMETALTHLDEQYGGAAGYLRQAGGLDSTELDALRDNLLAEPRPVSDR